MDEKHGLIIDLNKYRPGRDLKRYLDAGVDGFIFRIGGPTQWVEGNWRYAEDPTWRPYMDQAKALGIQDRVGGYIVHNPFEDWRLQGVVSNVHLNLLNQWTSGGYMPGYFILDHEINYCWRGNQKIIVTVPNLVASLASVTDQIYKQWRKMVMIYTGRWFIDQNGPVEHATYLDNINRPETGKQRPRPMWYAWYLTMFGSKTYTNLRQAITDIPTPTGDAFGKYLQCGSYSGADLWQFTDRLKLGNDVEGVDASVTWGTLEEYWRAVGVSTSPEPEPEPEPPPVDLSEINAKLDRIIAELEGLKWLQRS